MVNAEFFDIFGFMGFIILLVTGLSIKKRERIASRIIIAISIIGIIIDGYIVIKSFIIP